MKRNILATTILAFGIAASLPMAASAGTSVSVVIGNPPPPLRFESVPAPRNGYLWAPGYWAWNGHRHDWVGGRWEVIRPGHHYQQSEWRRDRDGWRFYEGGWQPVVVEEMRAAPPAVLYERVPHPRPGYFWSPGHWEWRGHRYDWVGGIWIAERSGYVYAHPRWVERDGRWFMEQGRWDRHDRDHDGIPNRYDRDRDGDGVPNRYDRHPDNPRRN